jgi:diadenosine tetraphosphate (Ap4A) HIT family hydrolase
MSDANDPCIFCKVPREIIAENKHAYASWDTYPVSEGHALVTPRRHVRTIWDMDDAEYADCFLLVREVKKILDARFKPDGYNIGANCETAGGQSVWHAHIHVIPRYTGDVESPRGGVRNVIPLKARYVRK